MRTLARVCLLTLVGSSVVLGQVDSVPAKWIGTWALSLPESKLGQLWGPGVPEGGLTFTGQTLKLAVTAWHLRIAGDTVTAELGSLYEESDVNLDGAETVVPPDARISFRRISDSTFDLIVKVNNKDIGNHVGENRFVFSADGKTLTETKTHTEREVVADGTDQTKGTAIRTSTTILVFHKILGSN
jgi:hypothetical protein